MRVCNFNSTTMQKKFGVHFRRNIIWGKASKITKQQRNILMYYYNVRLCLLLPFYLLCSKWNTLELDHVLTFLVVIHWTQSVKRRKYNYTTTRDCKKKSNNWWRRFDTNQSLNSRDPNGKRNTNQRQSCEERGWCWCCYCFWRFHANFHRKIRLMINTFSRRARAMYVF